jgi:uncharacterized protein (TIGR03437 family)
MKPILYMLYSAVLATVGLAQIPSDTGWVQQNSTSAGSSLRAVTILDAKRVVAVGDDGAILRTVDGGATWRRQPTGVPNTLFAVSFFDVNNGIAVGGLGSGSGKVGILLRTKDGGVSWMQPSVGRTNAVWGLSFNGSETGVAVGDLGAILRTTDGGATWQSHDDADLGGLRAVVLLDANKGIAVGGGEGIHRTTDGGVTWTPKSPSGGGGNRLYAGYFSDANNGTAVGNKGRIVRTTDGGGSWKEQLSGTSNTLYGIFFTDASNGVAVGDRGVILRTNNGGVTWKAQNSGTTNPLYGVSFDNAILGWIVGADGLILHTTTGGEIGPVAVSSATFLAPLAPNSLASLFGARLATVSASAENLSAPLPLTLGGISLKVRDSSGAERLAGLLDVSPEQVRFVLPDGTASGNAVLELINAATTISPMTVEIRNLAPGLFTSERNVAAAYVVRLESDGSQSLLPVGSPVVLDDRPAYLILYGTGIRNRSSLSNVRCTIGGVPVPVEYAGPNGDGVPGLDQVNVRLTTALKGSQSGRLVLTVDGIPANSVFMDVR